MPRKSATIHTAELPREHYLRYQELVAEQTALLLRFAAASFAHEVSNALRRPYTRPEWLALSSAERTRQVKAVGRTRAKAALARELAPEPVAKAPTERVFAPPYVVACACCCGTGLPARGPRPVVAYVPGHRPRPKPRLTAD